MIQEKDFLYRVPVKTAPITTPRGQIRNPEILVDPEGGEFMHGNILDANSTNKLINKSVKDAVDDKFIENGYVTKDLLEAETSARTKGDEALGAKIKAEQTRAEGKEKEISDKLAIVNGDSNTEGSFRKAIADVIAAAPEDLDTLKEIADKLAGNDDLHIALNQAITEKADASALANEVSRATGAESGLQAAIATKADATALSNYVLTTALNQQVDTLNTAISAKQNAGNYIPYDSTDVSNYTVDRTIKVLCENGYTTLDFGHIGLSDNNASDLSITAGDIRYSGQDGGYFIINPHQIIINDGYCKFDLNGNELCATSVAGERAKDMFRVTGEDIAIQQIEGLDYLIKINSDGIKIKGKTDSDILTGNGSFINIDNYAKKSELPTVPKKTSELTNDSIFIQADFFDKDGYYLSDVLNFGLKNNGMITIDSSGIRSDVGDGFMLDDTGITFIGKSSQQIPTAGGDFINISDLASAEDISSLRAGLSKKQDKITANEVDVTDIETADITKLRTIVTNLINALSASNLIRETDGLE